MRFESYPIRRGYRLGLSSVAILTALAAAGADGQTTQKDGDDTHELQEVVVTARKHAENIQTIPESVQSLDSNALGEAHVTRIDDLGNLVSNLNITTRADNTPDVVLRGVGSFGVVNGVGFYANDVQLFDGQTVRTQDLDRVEVLKGPQGTLYGGSNIGGAIKYVTKLPTDQFEGEASVEYGNYDTKTYSGVLSGPLVPGRLDGRISFFDSNTGGYINDPTLQRTVDGGVERGGRATLKYDGDDTTVILYLDGDRYRTGSANLLYTPASPTDYSYQVADGTRPSFVRGLYSATLNVEHKFDDELTLTSISSYFHSYSDVVTDVDKGPLPFLTAVQDFKRDVITQEIRLENANTGPLTWLVGLFGQSNAPNTFEDTRTFNGDPSNPANFADPTQYSDLYTDLHQRHHEYAVFGDAKYDWDRWTFEAGLRIDRNFSGMTDRLWNIASTEQGTEYMPKFSVSYQLADHIMSYGTISRGFEPGDLNEGFGVSGNPVINSYQPEKTWNYEIGIKSTLFDRVRLNAAAFYIDYSGRLFQTNALESNQFVQVIENIGASHNYGAEFDMTTKLTSELQANASFGVTRAVWGNVPYYDPDLNTATNLQGQIAPFTPAYQGSLTLDWNHNLTDELVLGARVDTTFVGRQYWDVTDHYQQPAYQLVNLGLRLETDHWSLLGHVSNLFETRYNTVYISAAELQAPFNVAGIGRPRLWSLSATYRF